MTLQRRLPPKLLRRLILSTLLGIAIGVSAWYLGMDAPHSAGLGGAVLALAACLSAVGEAATVAWRVPAPQPRPGSRRDVTQLGWSLGSRGGKASPEGVRRLRTLAFRVLAARGIDIDDPESAAAIADLLGPETTMLLRRGTASTPRAPQVTATLRRLEALVSAAAGELPPGQDAVAHEHRLPALTRVPALSRLTDRNRNRTEESRRAR
jgi:hypothetical protein